MHPSLQNFAAVRQKWGNYKLPQWGHLSFPNSPLPPWGKGLLHLFSAMGMQWHNLALLGTLSMSKKLYVYKSCAVPCDPNKIQLLINVWNCRECPPMFLSGVPRSMEIQVLFISPSTMTGKNVELTPLIYLFLLIIYMCTTVIKYYAYYKVYICNIKF